MHVTPKGKALARSPPLKHTTDYVRAACGFGQLYAIVDISVCNSQSISIVAILEVLVSEGTGYSQHGLIQETDLLPST